MFRQPLTSIPSHQSLYCRQGCQQYRLFTSEECSTVDKRIDHPLSGPLDAVSIGGISSCAASADEVRALVNRRSPRRLARAGPTAHTPTCVCTCMPLPVCPRCVRLEVVAMARVIDST